MEEELIHYGHEFAEQGVWGFPIALYLMLGGMVAGLILSVALYYLKYNKEIKTRAGNYLVTAMFILLAAGSGLLMYDLHRIGNFYQLFLHFDTTAPMSWGAWVLMANFLVIVIWGFPHWAKYFSIPVPTFLKSKKLKILNAWFAIPLALVLASYTGILLNVMVAKPLWYSNYLPVLFLLSGFSAGVAVLMGWGRLKIMGNTLIKIDLLLIGLELLVIGLYFVDLFNGTTAQATALLELLTGKNALTFWIFVIFIGLLLPLYLEIRELFGRSLPRLLVPVLVLAGSFALRYVIVLG